MSTQGSKRQSIIEANIGAGNDLGLAELIAAYDIIYQRFNSDDVTTFYTSDPEESLKKISDLRPSVERFIAKNRSIDPEASEFLSRYADLMRRQGLPFIFSIRHLAEYLGTSETNMIRLAQSRRRNYHTSQIPKKNGGFRTIDAPNDELKSIQSIINKKIFQYIRLHGAATGFRAGKSIRDNAVVHQKKYAVYGLDLEDFFHSITERRVFYALENLGFTKSVAQLLASLCCYEGRLPMGAPSSPALSNLVASRLDRRLAQLAKVERARYTRYADDLTFSFKRKEGLRAIPLIKEIVEDEGFIINKTKEELRYRNQRQYVTGLVVNERLNVRSQNVRKIRAVLHNVKTKGVLSEMAKWGAETPESFRSQLDGHIAFIAMVNSDKARNLRDEFNSISWKV